MIAAGIVALRDAIRAVLPDDVEVFDGPAESRPWAARAVTVAAAFEDDQNAINVGREFSGARPHLIETAEVACSVYAGSGDADLDAAAELRAAAGEILAAIDSMLRHNRTLGGVVAQARLTRADWVQGRDSAGTGVVVGFVVDLRTVD